MARLDLHEVRYLTPREVDLEPAARLERAGRRFLQHVRRRAFDRLGARSGGGGRPGGGGASRGTLCSSPKVYGWRGVPNSCSAEPVSMNIPPYITFTRSH